jgi:hypothetical protein
MRSTVFTTASTDLLFGLSMIAVRVFCASSCRLCAMAHAMHLSTTDAVGTGQCRRSHVVLNWSLAFSSFSVSFVTELMSCSVIGPLSGTL